MTELNWIDLIGALERAISYSAELDLSGELPEGIHDELEELLQKVRKAKKKVYI